MKLIRSMKFGITLLILIMVLSLIGTVIPQGMDEHFYHARYQPILSKIITMLGFNNLYNSILFGALFIVLTLNLILCSISRFNSVIKKFKTNPSINAMELVTIEDMESSDSVGVRVKEIFRKYGFKRYFIDKTNTDMYYSMKNIAGYFGSWLLHLGILLVIVYYAYGHITYFSESVYGIPGTVQELQGTDYKVKINDFNIIYGQDGAIQQYTSNIEFLDNTENTLKSSQTALNEPMRFEGYSVYQTAYGWAAKCNVSRSGTNLLEDVIYEKTSLSIPSEDTGIYFNSFYPDFAASSQGFISLSDQLNNPVVLYSVFYMGEVVKMDIVPMGEVIKWNEYEFILHSPQRYTYLDVNKMNGQIGAGIGALLVIIGILLVFYFKPIRMLINSEGGKLYVYRYTQLGKSKTNYQKEKDSYVR